MMCSSEAMQSGSKTVFKDEMVLLTWVVSVKHTAALFGMLY